jgi:hypothetical protein
MEIMIELMERMKRNEKKRIVIKKSNIVKKRNVLSKFGNVMEKMNVEINKMRKRNERIGNVKKII